MVFNPGPHTQLRRLDYQQMLDEEKQNPGTMRRRACMACVTPVVIVLMSLVLLVLYNVV